MISQRKIRLKIKCCSKQRRENGKKKRKQKGKTEAQRSHLQCCCLLHFCILIFSFEYPTLHWKAQIKSKHVWSLIKSNLFFSRAQFCIINLHSDYFKDFFNRATLLHPRSRSHESHWLRHKLRKGKNPVQADFPPPTPSPLPAVGMLMNDVAVGSNFEKLRAN